MTLLLATLVVAIAIGALVEWRRLKQVVEQIEVRRWLPPIAGRDREFIARLEMINRSPATVLGQLRDVLPAHTTPAVAIQEFLIPAQQTRQFEGKFKVGKRGQHEFGPIWIRLQGRWKLLEAQWVVRNSAAIRILPESFASSEHIEKDSGAEIRLMDKAQRSRQRGAGAEFESLQPFRFGDDPRRIDWRATARQRSLIVRHFQIERHRDVMILLDSGRLMGASMGNGSKLDCAVDAALHLARVVLQGGDRCGVATYDQEVHGLLPPIGGSMALRSIVDCVYDLQTHWHESDFAAMLTELRRRQMKRTFFVILSDLADAETSRRTCASLIQLQLHHLVLFAALRTPVLHDIVHQSIGDLKDVSQKVVVFRLLRDRQSALHELTHNGVHVLDVEPSQLTTPLINQFIELRHSCLL